jgi:hypothetical protein
VSTVSAMLSSFFASQQTFCFLQLMAEKESSGIKNRFRALDPGDSILTKVKTKLSCWTRTGWSINELISQDIVKRHSDSSDELNLKTPSSSAGLGLGSGGGGGGGPQPHPSWVYRNNYAPFNPNPKNPVKRSLSLLGSTVAAAAAGGTSSTHKFEQLLNNPTRYEKPASSSSTSKNRGAIHQFIKIILNLDS